MTRPEESHSQTAEAFLQTKLATAEAAILDLEEHSAELETALRASQARERVLAAELEARVRKRTAQLEEQKALLETIFAQADDGIWVCDPQGQTLFYNEAARRILQAPPSRQKPAVALRECGEFREPDDTPIPPEDWPISKALRNACTQGRPMRLIRTDDVLDLLSSAAPLKNTDGTLLGAVMVFADITPLRRSEQERERLCRELQQKVTEFQTLLDLLPVGIAMSFDPEVRQVRANPKLQRLLNLPTGSNLSLTPHPDQLLPAFHCFRNGRRLTGEEMPMQQAAATGREIHSNDLEIARNDGIRVNFYVAAKPLFDENKRVRGVISAFVDITELKRKDEELRRTQAELEQRVLERTAELAQVNAALLREEEALREADRRKDQFLAMLAHELRNPLSPICTAVELIRRQAAPRDPQVAQWTETIRRQVAHLIRIVDDLLDTSRISRGLTVLKKEPMTLSSAISQAAEANLPLIEGQRQVLHVKLSDEPLLLIADPMRLVQILSNLINNAAKYTPQGGCIHVSARRENQQAVVEVQDNGAGIPPEILPHIFELFYQADTSLDRAKGGLGLGLTLVRQLTDLHGGTIEAYSAGLGRGSRFTLRLPLPEQSPAQPVLQAEASVRKTVPRLKVLVVEDNTDSAESLGEVLELWGHEVWLAHNGPDGIAEALTVLPDVVLLDIGLPGMDGYKVAECIRAEPTLARTTLVALTGYNPDRGRNTPACFTYYLTKPVDLEELEKILCQHKR